ncbi:MAG: HAD family hydrolase [Halodesulfurarchaeum sp.]
MTADAVLFDLDDTLVTYERSGQEVLECAFDAVGVEAFFEASEYYDRYELFFEESDSIAHLRELVFADIAEEKGFDPDLGIAVAEAYEAERDHTRVYLLPGVEALLEALGDRPLGLVTNGDPAMQRPKLAATGLTNRFDSIVYAGHDAPAKPAPEPFFMALDQLAIEPEAATFVGNDPRSDVDGAYGAGLSTVWLRNGNEEYPDTTPDYTVDSILELLDSDFLDSDLPDSETLETDILETRQNESDRLEPNHPE